MKNWKLVGTLLGALSLAACGDEPVDPGEIALTEIDGAFIGPESAHFDSAENVWYVANFGQNLDLTGGTPDEPGYISRVGADGVVLEERFVELDGDFLGMAILDGTLYVSHGADLIEVNLAEGTTNTVVFPQGVAFLNDVAAGNGAVFISDTAANTIYRYEPGGEPEVFSQDPALVAPNGLLVDGDDLIVGTLGAFPPDPATLGGLFVVDGAGAASRLGDREGTFDGVEKSGDRYLVSDFSGPILLVDPADGSAEVVVDVVQEPHNLSSAADIGLDGATGSVLVPDLVGNKAYLFTLP